MTKKTLLLLTLFLTFAFASADASIFKSKGYEDFAAGKTFYDNKEYKQAILKFEDAFAKGLSSHKSKKTYIMMGRSYEVLGEMDRAFATYSKGLQLYPKDLELMIENADLYYISSGYSKAIVLYNQILKKDKENYLAHLGLGKSYEKLGFFSKAIGYYSLYFDEVKNPNQNYFYNYAYCYYKLDNFTESQEIIAENLTNTKNDADYLFLSGKIYWKVKQYDKAFQQLDKALELDSSRRDIELTKALWHYSLGKYSDAEKIANKYINQNKEDTLAMLVKSMCLIKKQNKTKADRYLAIILEKENSGFIYQTALKLK